MQKGDHPGDLVRDSTSSLLGSGVCATAKTGSSQSDIVLTPQVVAMRGRGRR